MINKKKNNFRRIGTNIKGFEYPVVNEREVRTGAGIMFLIGIMAFILVTKRHNYEYLYFTVPLFLIDFAIKVFIGPHLSPISVIAKLTVKNQKPEWVGAIQKRFAWSLGLFMATLMTITALIHGNKRNNPIFNLWDLSTLHVDGKCIRNLCWM